MAREKRRVLGQVAAFEIAWVVKMVTGESVDPDEINPFKEAAAKAPAPEPTDDDRAVFRGALRRWGKAARG